MYPSLTKVVLVNQINLGTYLYTIWLFWVFKKQELKKLIRIKNAAPKFTISINRPTCSCNVVVMFLLTYKGLLN